MNFKLYNVIVSKLTRIIAKNEERIKSIVDLILYVNIILCFELWALNGRGIPVQPTRAASWPQ